MRDRRDRIAWRRLRPIAVLILLTGASVAATRVSGATLSAQAARESTVIREAQVPDPREAAFSPVHAVGPVGLTVSDLDRAVEFFTRVLSFVRVDEAELRGEDWERLSGVPGARLRVARLRLGTETIELTEYLTPKGRPVPPDSRSNDRWFQHIAIVVSDMGEAYARLRAAGVEHASTAPQRLPDWNPNAGGIEAFYFKDPDGHVLEVIRFPEGKGDPRWQAPTNELFLGIDHTAIVVEDTERSFALYRDALGLRIAGESLNYGPEQERLNDVAGARLRITALKASAGPGIEFLEYLTPTDGRPYPADARANDLIHWQTTLVTDDLAAVLGDLVQRGYRLVSSEAVELASHAGAGGSPAPAFRAAAVIRDADGHALRLVEP